MHSINSKAISPMIASVLLIAFTVAVGGILSIWMTGFTTTTTGSVESASTNQTKCAGTYIDIISVANEAVIITNRGTQTILNPKCYYSNGSVIGFDATLASGASLVNATYAGRGSTYTVTSLTCSGTCLNIGVTGECKSGQTCWR